jgi:hypothetical protein
MIFVVSRREGWRGAGQDSRPGIIDASVRAAVPERGAHDLLTPKLYFLREFRIQDG